MTTTGTWHGMPHQGDAEELGSLSTVSAATDVIAGRDVLAGRDLSAASKLSVYTGQGGGWRDMIGLVESRGAGPTFPAWQQIGATAFSGYNFALNDLIQINFHLQHDATPGPASPIFFHAHWLADGVDAAVVRWEFTWSYARGFGQEAFNLAAPATDTVDEATGGVQYRHMTSELALPAFFPTLEPDGIIMCRLRRVTNGGVDNADGIFLMTADAHYQSDTFNTRLQSPPFY